MPEEQPWQPPLTPGLKTPAVQSDPVPRAAPDEEAALAEAERDARRASAQARRPSPRPAAPDRSPPHSAEAEEHVIATILLDGSDTLQRAIEAGLPPAAFYFPANRLLYEICLDLRSSDKPVMLETLAEELKTRRQLDAAGGFAYLMQVTGKVPTTAHAGYFIEKVREKFILRESIKAHTEAVEQAYGFTGGLEEYLQVSRARLEAITRSGDAAREAEQKKHLAARRVRVSAAPPEPQTRLLLADKPICTPGNITTLISRAKTGKTATLGAATAAIITAATGTSTLKPDNLGFTATNPNGHAVIVIDTEQSPFDAYTCYKRSLDRAGTDQDPKWLYHYALVGMSHTDVKRALDGAIALARAECKAIFCIILDGVADFVASVNDEAECNGFVTWLRERTVTHDCPAICVIHSNEAEASGNDGRGHLGKQLMRKAESNLVLEKTDEITTITSDKQRKAPITKADGISFQWSDEHQRHVTCGKQDAPRPGRRRSNEVATYLSAFPTSQREARPFMQVYRVANNKRPIARTTFFDLVELGVKNGDIQVDAANVNEPKYWVDVPGLQ